MYCVHCTQFRVGKTDEDCPVCGTPYANQIIERLRVLGIGETFFYNNRFEDGEFVVTSNPFTAQGYNPLIGEEWVEIVNLEYGHHYTVNSSKLVRRSPCLS